MSQESLASMAASEGFEPTTLNCLPAAPMQFPSLNRVNNKMIEKQEELQRAMGDDMNPLL